MNHDLLKVGHWYAIAVNSGSEQRTRKRILESLDRKGLLTKDVQLICPEDDVVITTKRGERKRVKEISLPGYLLLHGRRRVSDNSLALIKRVKGVLGFLGPDDRPTPLHPDEIEQILGTKTGASKRSLASFAAGDRVRIIDGPMSDFSGQILEVNESQGKARVEVKIFGQPTPAEVPFQQLLKEG